MHKVFSVISTNDRFEQLCNLIESINKYYVHNGWELHGVLQGYTEKQIKHLQSIAKIPTHWKNFEQRLGMFNARQEGMKDISSMFDDYVLVCLDDDIEFCEYTTFEKAVEYVQRPNIGLLSTNWISSEKLLHKKVLHDKLVKQPIVYTGGGLVIKKPIAELIMGLEQGHFYSDNVETSMRVYIAGYENYRYLGSISIHRACRSGGRKAWVNAGTQKRFSDPRLIGTRKCKSFNENKSGNDDEVHIGDSSDLTLLAKKLHAQNLKLRNDK